MTPPASRRLTLLPSPPHTLHHPAPSSSRAPPASSAFELVIICLQYQATPEERSTGGGRRGGASAVSAVSNSDTQLSISTFTIAPVTALTQGVIASTLTFASLLLCIYIFRWGNSRQWTRKTKLKKVVRSRVRGAIRRLLRCGGMGADEAAPPAGMKFVYDQRRLTTVGWVCLLAGCVTCPGCNLLALVFCTERKKKLVLVEEAEEEGGGLKAGDLAGEESTTSASISAPLQSEMSRGDDRGDDEDALDMAATV